MSEVEEVISEESGSEEDSDWEEWADDEDEVVVEEVRTKRQMPPKIWDISR